ncbi:MAG: FAD-binding oxidoreductase [Solirubrobacterales bacterium]|nr:FAD-binding oxidoreductase [Solirubrobacterales bacterium]
MGFDGTLFSRGDSGYEAARRGAVWNAFTPERYPELILQAASESDCVAAVKLAREKGLKLSVRSGGHSWAGNHLRDGTLLLDLSGLREVEIDAAGMRASAQPGCPGNELDLELEKPGLFFPVGHCPGVAIGGYLLQGGFGWNGRVHGPACQSVVAIDLVTPEGELVTVDEENDPDLFWAARGSGPGFFSVVTRYHLKLYPRPPVIANGIYTYPLDALEEVITWAKEVGPRAPRWMELMVFTHRDQGEPEVVVTAPVLAPSEAEAREALALLESCPANGRAKIAMPYFPARLEDLYAGVHASYPDGHRYAVDNMWTHAPAADLLPGIRRIAETLPEAPSHMLWMNWGESPAREEMAYSVEDEIYIALYAVWQDPAGDEENVEWATGNMKAMEHLASGIQLADENLGRRPANFVREKNLQRLDRLRAERDPDGLFLEWMGRPA